MKKLFLDSNIIIDALSKERPEHQEARLLLALGAAGEFELWTSPSQWTDLFYILTQGGRRVPADGVKGILREVRRVVRVCVIGESEIDAALVSPWTDFEDAAVYQCAVTVSSRAIITRNQEDFAPSIIPIFSCSEFFAWMEENEGIAYAELGR